MLYIILSPNTDNILTIHDKTTNENSRDYLEYGFIVWAEYLYSNSHYTKPLLSQITGVFNPQVPKHKTDILLIIVQ